VGGGYNPSDKRREALKESERGVALTVERSTSVMLAAGTRLLSWVYLPVRRRGCRHLCGCESRTDSDLSARKDSITRARINADET